MLGYLQEELPRAGHDRGYRLSSQIPRKYSASKHPVMVSTPTASPSNHGDNDLASARGRVHQDAELAVLVGSLEHGGVSSTLWAPRQVH